MTNTYTTISGDMWDLIAYKVYGDEMQTDKLIRSNSQYKELHMFPAGIVLDIPDIEPELSAELPPWKRG